MELEEIYKIYLQYPLISTDTRNIKQNSIFFALKGEYFNGNEFAEKAIENGAAIAIIDEAKYEINEKYILVDNVLETLQQIAAFHRDQIKIPVIGITGTNGKTTTKELINCVLSQKYKTLATQGNLNNHIGVPLTILSITNNHEIAIIEMGANHIGEIAELCEISKPDYGIITNIGKAHLEGFGSLEGVIKTKNDLYLAIAKKNGKVFVNADNQLLMDLSDKIDRISYGKISGNYCYGELDNNKTLVGLNYTFGNYHDYIDTQLVGGYNFDNILAAITIGCFFNVENSLIKIALQNYKPSNNRSQIVINETNTIILDAYNANPSSLEAAISNFAEIKADYKVLIIGDMLELGEYSQIEHTNILQLIHKLNFDKIILVGQEFKRVCKYESWCCFDNSKQAQEWLKLNPITNASILIKGSRGIKMEIILNSL